MATAERRNGVSRRGMTVLGKVPIVPKPINLPSQRSEFCWDRFPNGGGLSGKYESVLVDPVVSDDKLQTKLLTPETTIKHGDGLDPQEKKMQFHRANAATTNTTRSNNVQKMEETKTPGTHIETGKQEIRGPSLQNGGDVAYVSPGFSQNPKPNIASTDSQFNGAASGMNSETQTSGLQNHSGAKEREIIVIHMVGASGFYGNFPPHFGFPESYNRNGGVSGNIPLQFGNFEPLFGLQGNGGPQFPTASGSDYSDEHEGYICYEKECFKGTCHDVGRHRNSWSHGNFHNNSFVGGIQGEAYNSSIPGASHSLRSRSLSHKHLTRYPNGRVIPGEETHFDPVSENRITLLTKFSQHGVLSKRSLKATASDKDAELSASHVNAALYDDEGKPPIETLEDRKGDKVKIKASLPDGVSSNLEIIDKETCPNIAEPEKRKVLSSKISCNEKCLHCKGTVLTGESPTSLCQSCEKTTVCESTFSTSLHCMEPPEEVPVSTAEKDISVDGCKVDVKHIILDANNHRDCAVTSTAASQQKEAAKEGDKCSTVSPLSNSGTGLSFDTSLTNCEKRKQLVYIKKCQLKLTSKPGIRISKAHVKTKRFDLLGTKPVPAISSDSSSNPEDTSEEKNEKQNIISLPTSHLSDTESSRLGTSAVAPMDGKTERERKLDYKKRVAKKAVDEKQSSVEKSKTGQPIELLSAVVHGELVHDENRVRLTSFAADFESDIIQKRVYCVVQGSKENFLSPTAPLSSNDNNKRQLEKAERKKPPTKATSSLNCAMESCLLQEPAVEIKASDSFFKDASGRVDWSILPSSSASGLSRQGGDLTKKPEKLCRQLSAWRPKVGCQVAIVENSSINKEKKTRSSTPEVVGTSEEHAGLSDSSLTGDLNALLQLKAEKKDCFSLDHGPGQCEKKNQLSFNSAESPAQNKLVEKNISERSFPQEEVNGSVKQAAELAPCTSINCNLLDNLAAQEVEAIGRQETVAGTRKPFIKKKPMSYEEANQYHQVLFKRYKEIGQWRPKANVQKERVHPSTKRRPSNQVDQRDISTLLVFTGKVRH